MLEHLEHQSLGAVDLTPGAKPARNISQATDTILNIRFYKVLRIIRLELRSKL
jgi:hypothetical protein